MAPSPRPVRTTPGRILRDRLARFVVSLGGVAIIAGILGILVFLLVEVAPLLGGADVSDLRRREDLPRPGAAILLDPYRTHVACLLRDGRACAVNLERGEVVAERPVPVGLRDLRAEALGGLLAGRTGDGRGVAVPVTFDAGFEHGARVVTPRLGEPVSLVFDPSGRPLRALAMQANREGAVAGAAQLEDGRLVVVRLVQDVNPITEEVSTEEERLQAPAPARLQRLLLDRAFENLYGADEEGTLYWWRITGSGLGDPVVGRAAGRVSAWSLLLGEWALVVGREDGSIAVWFPITLEGGARRLAHVRDLPPLAGSVRAIAPSQRNKSFLAADATGGLGLYYSTTGRRNWQGESPGGPAAAIALAPKSDGMAVVVGEKLFTAAIHDPHPEVSLGTLFLPVWYEGYAEPALVWQSTGGTDDAEKKLSLTPLVFGTLKGTFFALFLAVPFAVLSAMYVSQFMHASLRAWVKPVLEIMAALPSVVLGFFAAIWLAPRLEENLAMLALAALFVPSFLIAAGVLGLRLPEALRARFPMGSESIVFVGVVLLALWVANLLDDPCEAAWFGGSVPHWIRTTLGLDYEQKNSVVIALAMSFAVTPIIFSIAEEAFSNVPRSLVAASLAMGANRWQTTWRVVMPTASPGIFSAVMVGFGRAIGETMIVLMATGNTPIIDWNPFNGFRTLSANIAVEIPEAPEGGTLYRTLFLAALLLFALTFVVNTLAEIVRQKLRTRYADL